MWPVKIVPRNDRLCVGWDVKPYSPYAALSLFPLLWQACRLSTTLKVLSESCRSSVTESCEIFTEKVSEVFVENDREICPLLIAGARA